jgi:hypothetical protein
MDVMVRLRKRMVANTYRADTVPILHIKKCMISQGLILEGEFNELVLCITLLPATDYFYLGHPEDDSADLNV